MVLLERVIDIVSSETEPHYPPDINRNEVTAVLCDDTVVIGMGYQNGIFGEYVAEPESIPTPEPSEQEILQAELLLNQMTILDNQTSQDAVMAEILLGQLGV